MTKNVNVRRNWLSWLAVLGLLAAGSGAAFLPWVWRDGVALQLTAPGLAEFVKFLPEQRLAILTIHRLYFLLPLCWAMLMLPLLASNARVQVPHWVRWLIRLTVIPLALASLPPVWTPGTLTSEEFRWQTIIAACASGLSGISPWLQRLPFRAVAVVLTVGGLVTLTLATREFLLVQTPIAEVYHSPVSLGWGWWVITFGAAVSGASSLWLAWSPPPD